MAKEGSSILETSPIVIALVFLCFLLITITFEKSLDGIVAFLKKLGNKEGLLAAVDRMKTELMCLGFAALILNLVQPDLSSWCVSASSGAKTWLDHVGGCSCCLTNTAGVSACYLAAKGCTSNDALKQCCLEPESRQSREKVCTTAFDDSDNWSDRLAHGEYTVNITSGAVEGHANDHRRLLSLQTREAEFTQCYGRYETGYAECNYATDKKPVMTANAIEQIHLMIFAFAISHILCSILVIVMASFRLHMWHRMEGKEKDHLFMVQDLVDTFWKDEDAIVAARYAESQAQYIKTRLGVQDSDQVSADMVDEPFLPETFEVFRPLGWDGRPQKLRGVWPRMKEFFACCYRQVCLNVVTCGEFCLMESSFILTHGIRGRRQHGFVFLEYLRRTMEEDFSQIVGLSIVMWIFIILFVLLSSAIGWAIWLFTVIAGLLLAVVNTKLVWIARYAARGGNVNRLTPGIFWLHRPFALAYVNKFLLFFIAFQYSNTVFFAIEFGRDSCFFSRQGFQSIPIPWWVFNLINTIYLFSLGLVTLPLYSITVQMGGDFKPCLLSSDSAVSKSIQCEADKVQERHKDLARSSRGFKKMISRLVPAARNSSTGELEAIQR